MFENMTEEGIHRLVGGTHDKDGTLKTLIPDGFCYIEIAPTGPEGAYGVTTDSLYGRSRTEFSLPESTTNTRLEDVLKLYLKSEGICLARTDLASSTIDILGAGGNGYTIKEKNPSHFKDPRPKNITANGIHHFVKEIKTAEDVSIADYFTSTGKMQLEIVGSDYNNGEFNLRICKPGTEARNIQVNMDPKKMNGSELGPLAVMQESLNRLGIHMAEVHYSSLNGNPILQGKSYTRIER